MKTQYYRYKGIAQILLGTLLAYILLRRLIGLPSTNSILLLTLLAIIWYSWETSKMKDQITEQNELSVRPLIVLHDERYGENMTAIQLINIGSGPAFNITLDEINIFGGPSGDKLDVSFGSVDIIVGKGSQTAPKCDPRDWYFAITLPNEYDFKIKYSNLNNKFYFTTGKIGKNKISFTGTRAV